MIPISLPPLPPIILNAPSGKHSIHMLDLSFYQVLDWGKNHLPKANVADDEDGMVAIIIKYIKNFAMRVTIMTMAMTVVDNGIADDDEDDDYAGR